MTNELPGTTVICGEALEVLRGFPENSVDAIVTDPPSSIGFMNLAWDGNKGGRDRWIAWLAEIMAEALRCLKPGGFAAVWSLPRTSHWTGLALERAGFEVRDCIYHLIPGDTKLQTFLTGLNDEQRASFVQLAESQSASPWLLSIFGSGFPKSLSISKALDRLADVEREVVGKTRGGVEPGGKYGNSSLAEEDKWHDVTAPATPEAQRYQGFGTALKPACEQWWLVRKPLSEKSVAANVLRWGVGGLNIDASRIPAPSMTRPNGRPEAAGWGLHNRTEAWINTQGRFPSHLLLTHSLLCSEETGCVPACPVLALDEQSGMSQSKATPRSGTSPNPMSWGDRRTDGDKMVGYNDQGGASRFFQQFYYCPKASRRERNAGLDALPTSRVAHMGHGHEEGDDVTGRFVTEPQANTHPTVTPLRLLRYLVSLCCPPGGLVLDCFAGSGSTGVACVETGMRALLIEKEAQYAEIARARVAAAMERMRVDGTNPES